MLARSGRRGGWVIWRSSHACLRAQLGRRHSARPCSAQRPRMPISVSPQDRRPEPSRDKRRVSSVPPWSPVDCEAQTSAGSGPSSRPHLICPVHGPAGDCWEPLQLPWSRISAAIVVCMMQSTAATPTWHVTGSRCGSDGGLAHINRVLHKERWWSATVDSAEEGGRRFCPQLCLRRTCPLLRLGPTMGARPPGASQRLKGNLVFIRKSQVALVPSPMRPRPPSSSGVYQQTGHREAAMMAHEGQYTGMRYHSCHRLSDPVHRRTHSTEGRVEGNVCADLVPTSLFRPACLGLTRRFGQAILDAGECLRRSGETSPKK